MTIIKHRKAIYGAWGAIETNVVMEEYDVATERAYDIIRSLEALQSSQKIDYVKVDKIINSLQQLEVPNV
ncbi:hypothetical protein FJQ98_14290 [Lysinibacillus agricola]|uniref:Uncharacterized protein n=1 Tax=Lysinibacillus agricola TaxID=2590012 RepID=A0ABX7ANH8_9BACI|nr:MULTISPECIES: hypothetical protein [Lysinibacillus]QQP10458.1 hypothetical protein FJQ98_14290 [Lysinibacillus agricola]